MSWLMGFIALTWWLWAAILYGAVFFFAVHWAIHYAREHGKSAKRWGWGAAFVMYSLVFWDWIPTVAVHQFYCAKDSGFWVYKTLDQWKAENPGVMEGLTTARVSPSTHQDNGVDHTTTYFLNQRFNWVVKKTGPLLLHRWRHEEVLVDIKTNEALARYINFSTSQERQQAGWNGWKFWLSSRSCLDSGTHPQHHFYEFENQLTGR